MILRMLILVLTLACSSSTLFAGYDRADRLINEAGSVQGVPGVAGPAGAPGIAGAAGAQGIQGIPGLPGAPGLLDFSDFFALMPDDNTATVGFGVAVEFPQTGSTNGVIVRTGTIGHDLNSTFLLPAIGTYLVLFQVSVDEAGQLELVLNGNIIADSVVGRHTGTDQIVGMSLVTTTAPNAILGVFNPAVNTTALTITPHAGGAVANPVSAHLIIIRIQ